MAWNRLKEGVYFLDSISSTLYNSMHTYKGWGLILESDDVSFPAVINNDIDSYLSTYGQIGLDVGYKKYGRRKLVFNLGTRVSSRWPSLVKTVTDAIHGKKKAIVRDCEPNYVYIGRCYVGSYVTTGGIGRIKIEVDAEPYKVARNSTPVEFTSSTDSFSYQYPGDYETPLNIYLEFAGYFYGDFNIACYNYSINGEKLYEISGYIPSSSSGRSFVIDGNRKMITSTDTYKVMYRFPVLYPGRTHYFRLTDMSPSKVRLFFDDRVI